MLALSEEHQDHLYFQSFFKHLLERLQTFTGKLQKVMRFWLTMGSSECSLNQTKKITETGTSQWSYIVMEGAKIFHGHY